MSRILVVVLVAVIVLATPLAADQALQNDDLQPNASADAQSQTTFVEATTPLLDVLPYALLAVTIGIMVLAVASMNGRGGL